MGGFIDEISEPSNLWFMPGIAGLGTSIYLWRELVDLLTPDYGKDTPQAGIKANTRSAEAIIPVVYGQQRVGGNIVYMNTSGTHNKFLHMVLLLAQGECSRIHQEDGVDQIFLDDKIYTDYGNLVSYEFFRGTTDQTVCTTLQGYFEEWTDTLQDYCYIYLMFEYDNQYFKGIPKVNVVLEGKVVYDPRYPSTPSPDDLLAWWSFDEGEGTTVRDDSGNGITGTFYNAPAWIDGLSEKALDFDRVAEDSVTGSLAPSGDISISVHFKLESHRNWASPLSLFKYGGGTAYGLGFTTHGGNEIRVYAGNAAAYTTTTRAYTFNLDTWYHVVLTYNSTSNNVGIYINAVKQGGNWSKVINFSNCNIVAGRWATDYGSYYFDGVVDEARVYNKELSLAEIEALNYYVAGGFGVDNTVYSTNAALAARDNMVNERYGWGVPTSMIDDTSYGLVATYFETTKGWSFNRVYKDDRNSHDIVTDMLKHARASLIYSVGVYYLKYKDTTLEASVMDLNYETNFDDDSIEVNTPSRFSKVNRGITAWIDKDRKYVRDEVRLFSESEYLREGDYRDAKIELLGCTDKEMASQLGSYYLERAILDRSISLIAFDEAAELEPHDLIQVTSYELAWTDQLCRVVGQSIAFNGDVSLSLIEEADILYDDVVNIILDDLYDLGFPDRFAEPPPVRRARAVEEVIAYRDRRFTRLNVTFTKPRDYVWFDYVEVWKSIDEGTTWTFYGNVDTDFNIENTLEGQVYYIALRVVNEWGVKQDPDFDETANPNWTNTYVISKPILGYVDVPESLTYLDIIVNDNAINIYSTPVDDDDVFVYELRLGEAWVGGIHLMSNETPNWSFKGVKPGNHSFYANTLSNNGLYGANPQGAGVSLPDPPPLWTTVTPGDDGDNYLKGTHVNTIQTWYDGLWQLRCAHVGGVLTGTWTGLVHDVGSLLTDPHLIYIRAPITVIGAGNTWDDQVPSPVTWDQVNATALTWGQIFTLSSAPSVSIKLKYGSVDPPGNTVSKMEILSTVLSDFRYLQIEITITDPGSEIYAYVEPLMLVLRRPT